LQLAGRSCHCPCVALLALLLLQHSCLFRFIGTDQLPMKELI
jgi:hypothetical protein